MPRETSEAEFEELGRNNQAIHVFKLLKELLTMSADVQTALDDLAAKVTALAAADASAEALLVQLSAEIKALAGPTTDPATTARINDLAAAIDSNTTALAAAVAANTPAG